MAQNEHPFWTPSDTFNGKRVLATATGGGLVYAGFSIGLYQAWYAQNELTAFHVYDDWGEWRHMDKAGHIYTTWFESMMSYRAARWCGIADRDAALLGAGLGIFFQSTIELMDGFSERWGFSWWDMAFNGLGAGAFYIQQRVWDEQRVSFKVSSWPNSYPDDPITSLAGGSTSSLDQRAGELYGTGFAERYLKDYNAQTIWASCNLHSLIGGRNGFPTWLNLAVGYSAEDMYGGYDNRWESGGAVFQTDRRRYSQFLLSPDVDLGRIRTDNHFVKFLLWVLNVFKLPAPAIEWNSKGQLIFHFLYL